MREDRLCTVEYLRYRLLQQNQCFVLIGRLLGADYRPTDDRPVPYRYISKTVSGQAALSVEHFCRKPLLCILANFTSLLVCYCQYYKAADEDLLTE